MSFNRFFALSGILALCAGVHSAGAEPLPLDRVVAIVNDEVITRLGLDQEVQVSIAQLRRQNTPLPTREVLEKQLLERLVTRTVLLQYAKQTGLRISEADVDKSMERIATENKLTPAALRAAVAADGISIERFREDIRVQLILARLRDREVDNKLMVTDAEVQSYLRTQAAQGERVEDYQVQRLVVSVREQATPEELQLRRKRAEAALSQINSGASFAQVVASFSDAPDAMDGGGMGWKPSGRLPSVYIEALQNMKVGATSSILRTGNGFHILRLTDKRGSSSPVIVNQARARHILIRLNEIVSEKDATARLLDLKARIENGADFGEMARRYSDDASAAKGGDLSWVSPGDTVPEFERAMDALKPGEISPPTKSPFGWHLIQVLERREQDMSADRAKNQARQALRSRKSEDQWQEWIRQQRDKAYVEHHLDDK